MQQRKKKHTAKEIVLHKIYEQKIKLNMKSGACDALIIILLD